MSKVDIIERIKKLLALSESANENEANIAARQANKLIEEYNVSFDELQKGEITKVFIKNQKKIFDKWESYLLSIVAENNFCTIIMDKGNNQYMLVGREVSITGTTLMFDYLKQTALRLAKPYGRNKKSFLMGFSIGVSKQFKTQKSWTPEESQALVLTRQKELKDNMDFVKKDLGMKLTSQPVGSIRTNDLLKQGIESGRNTNLSQQMTSDQRMIEAR